MSKTDSPTGQTRGRPAHTEAKIADMRQRITGCALQLFQKDGYHAVSMRRLASEVGCTVMTLYRYFDRKIDILRELWKDVFAELFDHLDQIAAKEQDALARLNAVALGYVHYWLDKREHYFLVFMSSDVSQPDVSVFIDDDRTVERFYLFFTCLAEVLGPDAPDIDQKAQLLLCSLNGIAHNLITISAYPWADPDVLVRAAVSGAIKS